MRGLTFEELKAKIEQDRVDPPSKGDCGKCDKPMISCVNITPGEPRYITAPDGSQRQVHDDCYFDGFGDELEQFPILPPRIRRGPR